MASRKEPRSVLSSSPPSFAITHAARLASGASIRLNDRVQVPLRPALGGCLAPGGRARRHRRSQLRRANWREILSPLDRPAKLALFWNGSRRWTIQAGATDAAREHYEAAANNFYAPPAANPSEQAATLNSLGALYLLRGDPESARKPLNQAASQTGIDPDLRAQILNNLGVMSEMNGDLATARQDYSQAHAQGNLARLGNVTHP